MSEWAGLNLSNLSKTGYFYEKTKKPILALVLCNMKNMPHRRHRRFISVLVILLCGLLLPVAAQAMKQPIVKILGHPARVSYARSATFIFFSNAHGIDGYLCSLDRVRYKSCTLMKRYYGIEPGHHLFQVKAVSNGVQGPVAHWRWTVRKKATAPKIAIVAHPALTTTSTKAAFRFSTSKAHTAFTCSLDRAARQPCPTGGIYTDLLTGYHTLTVMGRANGRNSKPQSFGWVISAIAPTNTVLPMLSGTPQVGKTLSISTGSWTGTQPITYTYQWQACVSETEVVNPTELQANKPNLAGTTNSICVDIARAIDPSFLIPEVGFIFSMGAFNQVATSNQVLMTQSSNFYGYYSLRVLVMAHNEGGQAEVSSAQSSAILPAAPVNNSRPVITGTDPPVVGSAIWTSEGDWNNYGDITYQWQRCDADGNSCVDIPAATSYNYTPQSPADVGSTLRSVVTDTNSAGSDSATSLVTAVVLSDI